MHEHRLKKPWVMPVAMRTGHSSPLTMMYPLEALFPLALFVKMRMIYPVRMKVMRMPWILIHMRVHLLCHMVYGMRTLNQAHPFRYRS